MCARCKYYLILMLLCGFLSSSPGLFAAHLHLIAVGDTLAADISDSIGLDLKNMEGQAAEIEHYTGLTLVLQRFTGQSARAADVLDYIKELETAPDDVVFFYFSGHGYRTPSKESNPWPNMYFVVDQSGLDLLDVASLIKEKEAHLSIIMADCCNNSISDLVAPKLQRSRFLAQPDHALIERNLRKLFIETSGQVVASGSQAGQFAYGNSLEGGRFSSSYFSMFNIYAKQAPTDVLEWRLLLDQTVYRTKRLADVYGHDQEPIYVIQK